MAVVAPNGQVRLLANVPLDDSFENTIYFASEAAQRTYFLGLTPVHTMSNATRVRDGVIAVNCGVDTILNCNYIMFQNLNFSSKWFYAFITGREYVNNSTTYVSYKIDDIQTYLISGDVTLLECLIERQHSVTDEIGDNIVGENIGASELVTSQILATKDLCHVNSSSTMSACDKIVALSVSSWYNPAEEESEETHDPNFPDGWNAAPAGITDGIPNSSLINAFPITSESGFTSSITNVINTLTYRQQSDSIIGGYILPAEMFTPFNASCTVAYGSTSALGGSHNFQQSGVQSPEAYTLATNNAYTSLNGYTNVKNKKLFTAPFNWIYIISSDGQTMALEPQYLTNKNQVSIQNYHCIAGVPEARLVLQGYKGQAEAPEYYFSYTSFPQFSFAVNGYLAWQAAGGDRYLDLSLSQTTRSEELMQNQIALNRDIGRVESGLQLATGAVQAYRGDISGGLTKVADSVFNEAKNEANAYFNLEKSKQTIQFANENADLKRSIAKTLPTASHGAASNTALLGANNFKIRAEQRCVNGNIAKTIDDYFTMYGYAQNIVAVPNINARPHYTYVKTVGCKVNGGAPNETITHIQSIFDNGIRFWVNASEVGKYNEVDNRPTTPVTP